MANPRWLNKTQGEAWRELLDLVNSGLPLLDRRFDRHDMLHVDYGLLVKLSGADTGSMRLHELADAAHITRSRLSYRLRHLTQQGLIECRDAAEDARGSYATLTKKGRAKLDAVAPDHADDVLRLIFDHLNPAQTRDLRDALRSVNASRPDSL